MLDLEDFLASDEDSIDNSDPEFTTDLKPEEEEENVVEDELLSDDPRKPEQVPEENEEPPEDEEVPETPKTPETPEISLIESFLERYNVVGGALETEEGNQVLFKDLTPEQQLKALEQIVDSTRPSVEEELGLNDSEKTLLTSIRDSKLSVEEFLAREAHTISEALNVEELFNDPKFDFEQKSDDEIYTDYLKVNNPDISEEDLSREVDHAKKSSLYTSTVKVLRDGFISNRESQKEEYRNELATERVEKAKKDSVRYVDAARGMTEIAGWPVNDTAKNELLSSFMELDAAGKSEFQRKVIDNPENALRAMWFLENGQAYFDKIDNYYKEKVKQSYTKGITDGRAGKSIVTARQSAIKPKNSVKDTSKGNANVLTLEDYIND